MAFKKIVVVDDEEPIRISLQMLLEDAGYEVTLFHSGEELATRVEQKDFSGYDLIITDMKMPGITGMMLIDILHQHQVDIPIMVMTGFSDKEMVMDLLRKGVYGFIEKPFTQEHLMANISEVQGKVDAEKRKIENEQARLNLEVENYRNHFNALKSEMDTAVNVYRNLVHLEDSSFKVNLAWKSRPFSDLGGDFADLRNNEEGCDLFVADVAGHDLGASFHTLLLKAFFDENCRAGKDGDFFFHRLNAQLAENGKNERMVTGQFARVDLNLYTLTLISAAHPLPVLFDDNQEFLEIPHISGDVLGLLDQVEFTKAVIPVKSGYRMFFYTDGIIENSYHNITLRKKDRLRREGLIQLLQKHQDNTLNDIIKVVWGELKELSDHVFCDDMLLLGIEIP